MTFIEAAKAVLDQEGRPLRSREIAEEAVALGLLSHVGKTPVQTMSARLSATVAKENSPFVRVRPGVFGLSEWHGNPPGPKKTVPQAPPQQEPPPNLQGAPKPVPTAPPKETTSSLESGERIKEGLPKETEGANSGRGNDSASQAKRRKRKKRKASHAPAVVAPSQSASTNEGKPSHDKERPSHFQAPQPPPQKPGHSEQKPSEQKQPAPSSHRTDTSMPPSLTQMGDKNPGEMLNHVEAILKRNSRPIPIERILELLGIKGESGPALLDALMATDALERERDGQRPRFVKHKSGFALVERETSAEIVALENQGAELRARLIQIAEKQLIRKLRSMPMSGFMRIMILYLQRSGFGAMVPVNFHRNGEFHLSVQDRRHQGRFCTGVILRKDVAEFVVREKAVMDLRGALHHYDAMNGMIFTTGQVSDKAIKEGRVPNLPPVVLMDGETLAREMVQLGIGVKVRTLSLPAFDDAFFSNIEP